ncbi:hypothetical protein FRC09_005767, partial [Ceratobasidium sp. 395]
MDPDQPRRPGRPKRRQLNINDDPPVAGSSTGEAAAAAGINVVRSGNESGLQPKPGRTHHLEAALSKFIEGDPEKYQKLLEDIQEAVKEVIERGSPLTRAKYASAKLSFEVTVKLLTPNVQPPLDPWARSVVNRYAEEYLEFRATVVRGRQGENVKAITVCGWYASLVVVIARNAYDPATGQKCGGVLLYREGLCKRLEDRVYTIIQQKKLVRFSRRRARRTFGPAEVQTVIEHLVKSSIDRGRLVRIQEWCALIMAMMAATRPGSLCAAHPEYKENKQYLQVGDLHLRLTGPVTYQIEIDIRHLKGSNQTAQGRVVNYLFGPVRLIKNLLFDNWVIVVYLWGRGCLPQYETLNDLINAKEDELVLSKKEEPFFLSSAPGGTRLIPNEALSSSRLSGNVGDACKASGFPDLAFYDLRKDAANDFERKLGSGAASLHLAHKEAATLVTEHYSLGAGNVDITGVRTGEAVDQFAHGYESRLAMRARDGTALCYISNVIALAGKTDSDDSDEEGGDENDNVERAMEKAKKAREVLVETAVENALRESEEVRKCQAVVEQRWDAWIQTFVPGSDLYMHYKLKSPYMVQTNISEVKKWAQYKAAVEEDAGFKAEVEAAEKALRDAFDSFATKKKFISKVTTRAIKKELDQKQIETHADTYKDKNRAIEYLERPSALAAKTSTSRQGPILQEKPVPEADQPVDRPNVQPSQEQILALNEEDDDLVAEEAVEEYNKLLNYLPAGFRDGVGSRIQKTLNEVQKDIQEQADAEIPDEQPKQEWGDDHDQEEYTTFASKNPEASRLGCTGCPLKA